MTSATEPTRPIYPPLATPVIGALIVQTRTIATWVEEAPERSRNRATALSNFVRVHANGLWHLSASDAHDCEANAAAVEHGGRILTAHLYREEGEEPVTVWVLTEAVGDDGRRASSCLLFPDDY